MFSHTWGQGSCLWTSAEELWTETCYTFFLVQNLKQLRYIYNPRVFAYIPHGSKYPDQLLLPPLRGGSVSVMSSSGILQTKTIDDSDDSASDVTYISWPPEGIAACSPSLRFWVAARFPSQGSRVERAARISPIKKSRVKWWVLEIILIFSFGKVVDGSVRTVTWPTIFLPFFFPIF